MSYGIHEWMPQALPTAPCTDYDPTDYDYDIIRAAGLVDTICEYLFYSDAPWHIDNISDHRSVLNLTSTHYYVSCLSKSRHDIVYFHTLRQRATRRMAHHAHLLVHRPHLAIAYAEHGWLLTELNTALLALTQFDIVEIIFKYMYADEIITFTTTAEYMSKMTARNEILDCLRAIRRRQTDDDIEAETMAQLALDIAAQDHQFPDSD